MFIRIALLCLMLVPAVSQAKILSQTFKVSHNNLKVIKGYQDLTQQGVIKIKTCSSCAEKTFTLTSKTVLAENGLEKPITDLLQIKLSNKTDHVLVQVNKFTKDVFYIEWGYPEGEEEGQE